MPILVRVLILVQMVLINGTNGTNVTDGTNEQYSAVEAEVIVKDGKLVQGTGI